jgi:hypothetical protein
MVENDEMEGDDYEEQIEQMMIENGLLLHAVVNVLKQKGLLKQEEIDAEVDKLYEEMDQFEEGEGE